MADYSELMKLEKKPVALQAPTEPATPKDVVHKSTYQHVNKTINQQPNKLIDQHINKSTN